MKYRSTQQKKRVKLLVTVAVLVVLAAVSVFVGVKMRTPNTTPQPTPGFTEKLDLNPATDQEKQQAEDAKNEIVKKDEQATQQQASNLRTVVPTIIDAGQYGQNIEVRAFVSAIYENGGTCTFTFAKGAQKITKTSPGVKDATTTRCTNLSVPKGEFSSGSWSVVVSYSSSTASGSSSARSFEVQ